MENKSNEATSSTADKSPAATTRKIIQKRVQFVAPLVTAAIDCSTEYDRTAVPIDIFLCDVCGMTISAGIRGFEPYGSCEICNNSPASNGFDLCGACCGTDAILQFCQQHYYYTTDNDAIDFEKDRPKILVERHHPHELVVIDRKAQVLWANDAMNYTNNTKVGSHATPKRSKKSPRRAPLSKSPRKKAKIIQLRI